MAKPKVDWDKLDMAIEHEGRAIKLPADPGKMPLRKAREALDRRIRDEEQSYDVWEWVQDAHPHDAAVAFILAARELYGFVSFRDTPTFFGPRSPTMLTVRTGFEVDDVVQVPLGRLLLPGMEDEVNVAIEKSPRGRHEFVIYGEIKKRDKAVVLELANLTRKLVREKSIYRGRAVSIKVNDAGELDVETPPEFMDVRDTDEYSLVFDQDIHDKIRVNLLTPITHTAEVKRNNIPLKRGILLHGRYGTGKSLTARMVANVAERHGWTFILLDRVVGLKEALELGKRYSPAVIFAEDIDRVLSERDEAANDLINTIDGVLSKKSQIMVVLTTNFVENINQVMLRPGRLDAVIELRAPGPEAVQRLIRHYGGNLIAKGADLTKSGLALDGQIPATIREVVDRSKLAMISRGGNTLNDDDIHISALTMKDHIELLAPKNKEPSAADRLFQALGEAVTAGPTDRLAKIEKETTNLETRVRQIHRAVA